jgi:hypothetical protein
MLPDLKVISFDYYSKKCTYFFQMGVFIATNGGSNTYAVMREIIYFSLDTFLELSPVFKG